MFCCVQPEDASGQLDYRYDEFGFKVEEEGSTHCVSCVVTCNITSSLFLLLARYVPNVAKEEL